MFFCCCIVKEDVAKEDDVTLNGVIHTIGNTQVSRVMCCVQLLMVRPS